MSKGHVFLLVLVPLLCVCEEKNEANLTLSPNSTITSTTPTPLNSTASTSQSQHTPETHREVQNGSASSPEPERLNITSGDFNHTDENLPNSNETESGPSPDSTAITTPSHRETSTETKISTAPGTSTALTTGGKPNGTSQAIGVIFLILILIIIVALAFLLFVLWKKGRSYSFDLTTTGNDDTPLRSMEHGGTFEQTGKELTSLDSVHEEKPHDLNSTANGCAGDTQKQPESLESQNVPEEDSFRSDTSLTPPMKKVEFNLDLDLIGGEPELMECAKGESGDPAQNENNNNLSNSGTSALNFFTEINLDEPQ
ncbi:uncharacterized protein [Hoplias malabaricus]|uniref:uncharacterized protein n=1 Tax=Hoplias malabaricus TaxID=27720 RepID=UPI0034630D98